MFGVCELSSIKVPDPSKKLSETRIVPTPLDSELLELEEEEEELLLDDEDAPAASSTRKLSIVAVPVPLVDNPPRFPVVQVLSADEMRSTPLTNTFLVASRISSL